MKLDLAAALGQTSNAAAGGVRAVFSGLKTIEIDEETFVGRIVDARAFAMGQNLHRGLRPDGSAPMPGRKKDGQPRGLGALLALRLKGGKTGALTWRIAPDREIPGHLARILREVPFLPPSLERLRAAVNVAFEKAVKVTRW
jgi:hypothetical protein